MLLKTREELKVRDYVLTFLQHDFNKADLAVVEKKYLLIASAL